MAIFNPKTHVLILVLSALPLLGQVSRPADASTSTGFPTSTLPEHKLGPNDLISIQVFDEPQVSRPSVRVGADGTIVIPTVPKPLLVAGLLPREVETEVKRVLVENEILVHPAVTVTILDYAYRQISITGNVRQPGQYNITGPITLYEAIAKAAGVTSEAGAEILVTRNPTEPPMRINLIQLQNNPEPSTNIVLNGGELISVPEAPKLFVTGSIARPGPVPVRVPSDATVLKVVSVVGGVTQYYNKTAYIYRADATGRRQEIPVPIWDIMHRKAQDVNLAVDDVLLIPDDNGTKRRALLATLQGLGGTATSSLIYLGLR